MGNGWNGWEWMGIDRMVSHSTMAKWTLCHMGCHSSRHRCGLLIEPHILLCWLSSRSSCRTEGGKIFGNLQQLSFCPLVFETFGSINQAGCDFPSSLGRGLTFVSDDPPSQRLSISIQHFNSVCFVQLIRFLINQDAPGVAFLFD